MGERGDAQEDRSRPVRIGISACLLGERVRWNGDHKRDAFLVDTVGRFVEWVPVCPEMELGLGTPRPPVQLERASAKDGGGTRLVEIVSRRDLTRRMDAFASRRVRELAALDLSGFVLKEGSPSCGLERVKVWRGSRSARTGQGRFAAALVAALPDLPVEDEGRLHDPAVRENFFERVFAWRRLAAFFQPRWTRSGLVEFHAREKPLLLAHDPAGYRALGRSVAAIKSANRRAFERAYRAGFMAALRKRATRSQSCLDPHLRELLHRDRS